MIANPFVRKPKRPHERALDALDEARAEAAAYAASVREAAAGVAETLTAIGPPARPRRLPLIVAGAGAALVVVWFARSRRSRPSPAPSVPEPSAAATASRTTAGPAAAPPLAPTATEAAKEPAATTRESEAAQKQGERGFEASEADVAATDKS